MVYRCGNHCLEDHRRYANEEWLTSGVRREIHAKVPRAHCGPRQPHCSLIRYDNMSLHLHLRRGLLFLAGGEST